MSEEEKSKNPDASPQDEGLEKDEMKGEPSKPDPFNEKSVMEAYKFDFERDRGFN